MYLSRLTGPAKGSPAQCWQPASGPTSAAGQGQPNPHQDSWTVPANGTGTTPATAETNRGGLGRRAAPRLTPAPTRVHAQVDGLIVNCSAFNPTPSLSAAVVNHFRFKSSVRTFNLSGMGCAASVIAVDMAREMLKVGVWGPRVFHVRPARAREVLMVGNMPPGCCPPTRSCPEGARGVLKVGLRSRVLPRRAPALQGRARCSGRGSALRVCPGTRLPYEGP